LISYIGGALSINQCFLDPKVLTGSFTKEINRLGQALDSDPWGDMWLGDLETHLTKNRCHRKSILTISLTCQRLYMISLPILWNMVEIDLNAKLRVRPLIVHILPPFVKSPGLARCVRSISFSDEWVHSWQESTIDPEKRELLTFQEMGDCVSEMASEYWTLEEISSHISGWTTTICIGTVLNLLPKLEAIKIHGVPSFLGALSFQNTRQYQKAYKPH
jgi:hypothetical protein